MSRKAELGLATFWMLCEEIISSCMSRATSGETFVGLELDRMYQVREVGT